MEWTPDQVKLIKDTICAGSTDDEFKLFLYTAKRTGLDPLVRQIHAVKRWSSELKREAMAIQVGIDGYRVIAERTGTYAGQDAPVYTFTKDFELESATITVYRLVAGMRVGFSAAAFYEEYVQTIKDGGANRMWSKMPRVMLAKCAEALAMRKAFPNDLSGIYTDDEMSQAGEPKHHAPVTTTAEVVESHSAPATTNGDKRPSNEELPDTIAELEAAIERAGVSTAGQLVELRKIAGGQAIIAKMTMIAQRNYHQELKKLASQIK
jgi:phage recombination protein Bet